MLETIISHSPLFYLTQSFWRDEAFTVLLSEHSFIDIVRLSAGDFTPPLYYVLLHYWMKVVGNSEIAVRMLSFLFHSATALLGYMFTRKFFPKSSPGRAVLVGVSLFINPMMIYYGFEARMYSMLAFFVLLSMYLFLQMNWKWYAVVTTISLYTHPYALFAIAAQGVWLLAQKNKTDISDFIKASGIAVLAFSPWLVLLVLQVITSEGTWFYPVDRNLFQSILGNMFLGFEGTPYSFWKWSKRISIIILLLSVFSLYYRQYQKYMFLILSWAIIPLVLVLGLSLFSPIFVNRYIIYVTIALVMLVVHGIFNIRLPLLRYALFAVVIGATLLFNIWFPPVHHKKVAFRDTFDKIYDTYKSGESIVLASPLSFFEAMYYMHDKDMVYIYNPNNTAIPQYVGLVLIPETKIIQHIPEKTNAYLIQDNGTYVYVQNK